MSTYLLTLSLCPRKLPTDKNLCHKTFGGFNKQTSSFYCGSLLTDTKRHIINIFIIFKELFGDSTDKFLFNGRIIMNYEKRMT